VIIPHLVRAAVPLVRNYGSTEPDPAIALPEAGRFGFVSASLLIATTLAGHTFDKEISERLKVPGGWGPLIGATAGLVGINTVAGLTQGTAQATGYAVGGAAALVPTAIAAFALKKSTSDDTTVRVLAMLAGGAAVYGIFKGVTRK
jgi:hypothetical protein